MSTPKYPLYHLPPQALATVLVALAQYEQRRTELEKQTSFPAHTYCETPFGTLPAMYAAETGELIASLQHTGLEFAEVVRLFDESATNNPYVDAAQEKASEGKFEIDNPGVVSKGEDESRFFTIQLASDYDSELWYFDDEAVYLDAVQYAQQHKQLIHTTVVDSMPPDSKLADPELFKAWVIIFEHERKPQR